MKLNLLLDEWIAGQITGLLLGPLLPGLTRLNSFQYQRAALSLTTGMMSNCLATICAAILKNQSVFKSPKLAQGYETIKQQLNLGDITQHAF